MVTKKSMNFMDQKVRRLRELERSGMDTGQIKANAPGGNISRPIRKVAQKKKTPSNAPGGMMKPRPPRPPRKDPGPLRKQPVRKQSMPKATNTSAETRAKVADLKKQIKKLMGQYK
jgi:hypothetical protein